MAMDMDANQVLEAYKAWVRKNANLVSSLEGAAQSAIWFLPERFSNSEVKYEALTAALGLLSLYNASIIEEDKTPPGRIRWPLIISAIQQLEVLVEIGAERWCASKPRRAKFDVICGLEAIKLALRIMTLHDDGGRILLHGSCTSDGYTAGSNAEARRGPPSRQEVVLETFARFREVSCKWASDMNGAVETLRERSEFWWDQQQKDLGSETALGRAAMWWDSMLGGPKDAQRGAPDAASPRPEGQGTDGEELGSEDAPETPPRSGEDVVRAVGAAVDLMIKRVCMPVFSPRAAEEVLLFGEVLHLSRPLIYCLLLRRYGAKSWKPFVMSLLTDLASSQALSLAVHLSNQRASSPLYQQHYKSSPYSRSLAAIQWTPSEKREQLRRRIDLLYYLIRSPFFDSATRPVLSGAQYVTSRVPLVGFAIRTAADMLSGIQQHYSYTSAS